MTELILALLLIGKRVGKAAALLLIYVGWTTCVVHRGAKHVEPQAAVFNAQEHPAAMQAAMLTPPPESGFSQM